MKKLVYLFSEGNASMRDILGGKGANLAEMSNLGLPVPAGFTISSEVCALFNGGNGEISKELLEQIEKSLKTIETKTGKKFGDPNNPLLVSVRSGSRISMPGMMDTVLNLGLNDKTCEGMIKLTSNPRFVHDAYRRFIQMFSNVVMNIDMKKFEVKIDELKAKKNIKLDIEMTDEDLISLIDEYKKVYKNELKVDFPQDPSFQLNEAIKAVFRSWNTPRAIAYRKMNDIPDDYGTACNIQTMVFGNMGDDSGSGVAFTRNPSTGEKGVYGEYLTNAQGEDVVAGIRTPFPISKLQTQFPELYKQFLKICDTLENRYLDMQDMEFTIEKGKLYMLQCRNGKRTATASLRIAIDLVKEGKIDEKQALMRIEPSSLDSLLHRTFDPQDLKKSAVIGTGLPASPGSACGMVVFSNEKAKEFKKLSKKTILVRMETSPEDIEGMHIAEGVLTARGGMTSHAAVVARGMGTCCVSGCSSLQIDENSSSMMINGVKFNEGDYLSIDGSTGNIYKGQITLVPPTLSEDFKTIMSWSDKYRKIGVRTNADTPKDAEQALKFGAEGIGLCRTEHMFFEPTRIMAVREMIVSETLEQRQKALDKLLPMQQGDFESLYRIMKGLPVTIRLLDPPLHEFVPKTQEEVQELSKDMDIPVEKINATIEDLKEFNPMMGHRGCRLAITYPEIAVMQTKAIINAAINVSKSEEVNVEPQIMIPLVGDVNELKYLKKLISETADNIIKDSNFKLVYHIGTMIEIPRAALLADEIASEAEFFSFGTNDLTQMTFGFSRDDSGKFLKDYYDKKIFDFDPFARIDEKGVGMLVKMAVEKGRSVRPMMHCGICGEHGGNPATIKFCNDIGLTYVSCSPYRVPIARLAGAQANIQNLKN
jgi:pyruvate, orthophosphate dikinase